MKHIAKRSLSLLMALVLFVSLFSGLTITTSAASYTYNWGYRGTTATTLSSAAQAFYADNGTSYETLSSYSGSSSTSSVPSSDLYYQLKTLMTKNHSYITGYDATKNLYQYTDCQGGGGAISSFYSGASVGPSWDGSFNREHTWPNSKGLGGSDENDIMMLRPTSYSENTSRGNTAYGISSSYYDPNSESGGAYNLHGDVARIVLYVYVRWGNTSYMWGSNGVMESKEVLLAWMQEDPVDTWELGRNDAVESITGTRNVFVDYPELAFLLFDEVVPATMTTPSGMAGASAYSITASSNDTAMGTVSVSGKNINAVPAEGYLASGYEIVSGTAEVTRKDNTFIVNASSDCEIKIIFAPKEEVTVTYLDNGVPLSSETVYSGDPITLPEYTGTAPVGCKFLGWSDVPVNNTETMPTYYKAGSSYTVNGATNIHALFSYTAEGGEGSGIWTLVTDASQLSAGMQVVIAENGSGVAAGSHEKTYLKSVSVTFSDDKNTIPAMPSDVVIFTLGGSTGAWTLSDPSGALLGSTATKSVYFNSGTTTWSISFSGSTATIENTLFDGPIQYNSQYPRFTTYTSGQVMPQLYMLDTASGSTFYTTSTCAHEDTQEIEGQAASCTANGYTAGVYCYDCDTYISGHEVIASSGHSYTSVVTPPTVTEDGYTTHTCGNCGNSYTDSIVPALGETYTVSFSVPVDAAAIEDMGCNTSGITLPAADELDGYTFLGWTDAVVEDSTAKPVVYEAGSEYVATENTTLYALYTYAVGGSGETSYVLATNINDLAVGDKVIIASSGYDFAMTTSQGSSANNRGQAAITKNADNTITFDASSGVAIMELQAGTADGTYAFYCPVNNGYLYAASSSSNNLKIKADLDANGSFLIEMGEDGACSVTAQGDKTRNMLRHNNGSKIFSCYGSGQTAVCFYVETLAGEVYYTTEIAHAHSGTYHAAVEATCASAGTVAYYSCGCGKYFADSACTEVLTSIVDPQKEHSFTVQNMEEKYLKSAANCQSAAVYYLSCAGCGAASESDEDVFTYGSTNPYSHPGEGIFGGETKATCTTPGYTGDTTCADCGEVMTYGQVIPATGHADAEAVSETASTCKTHGVKFHYHCDACGGDYLEKSVSAVAQTAEDLQLPLDNTNHEGGEEVKNAADATCDADGYSGDTCCVGCGEVLKPGETIPGGHTVENGICTRCEVYGICGDNLTWTYENGILTISGTGDMYDYNYSEEVLPPWDAYREQMTKVVIENGATSIGNGAFDWYYNIAELVIPDGITRIGARALAGCQGLAEIGIPNSVTYIGNNAFQSCWSLKEITIPASVTYLGEGVLWDCEFLQKAIVLADIDTIPNGTFHTCYYMTEVVIPDDITAIGDEAFHTCAHLESITIPETVTSIGQLAFSSCNRLTEITFAGDAPTIQENTFTDVTATAYYSPDATWVAEGVKQNYGGTITWVARGSGICGENLTWNFENGTLTISGEGEMYDYGTESNPENAPWAYYLEVMESIVVEEGVTSIGDHAFNRMLEVTSVSLPDTLTSIGKYAFFNCVALEEIVIPESVTSIGESAFTFCYALTDVTMPANMEYLGNGVFTDTNLSSIVIPDGIAVIGADMFAGCDNLTSVIIPEGVTSISQSTFNGCTGLTSIVLPESLETVGLYAFHNSGLTEITIPAGTATIEHYAFGSCADLAEICFAGNAPTIQENAFYSVTATANYCASSEGWTSDVLQNYGGTITWVANENATAIIGDVRYATLAEALAVAKSGDVVTLLKDAVIDGYLVIPNGVALNLADCSLTTSHVFASKDSFITANPDSGKLIVDKGNMVLGQKGYINDAGQYVLPIWDPAQGCYIFSLFVVNTDTSKDRGLTIDEEAEQIYFQFKHQATTAINNRLLSDGATDNELSVIIRLEWTNAQGTASQDFYYNDTQIGLVTGKNDYTFTLTGYSVLNIDLSTLKVTAMVVANSGATAYGTTWTQATAK